MWCEKILVAQGRDLLLIPSFLYKEKFDNAVLIVEEKEEDWKKANEKCVDISAYIDGSELCKPSFWKKKGKGVRSELEQSKFFWTRTKTENASYSKFRILTNNAAIAPCSCASCTSSAP